MAREYGTIVFTARHYAGKKVNVRTVRAERTEKTIYAQTHRFNREDGRDISAYNPHSFWWYSVDPSSFEVAK